MPFWPNLHERVVTPEAMDDPALPTAKHVAALRGLRRVNRVSDSAGIVWEPLETLARQRGAPLHVLDIATGFGDVPVALWHRARKHGVALRIDACDVSDTAVGIAAVRAAEQHAPIRFFRADVLHDPFPSCRGNSYDVVMCSLFLHHLSDEQAVMVLGKMVQAARTMVVVNDLERCRAGYLVAWFGTRLLTCSRVVHQDGPQSVAAGFTSSELSRLAERAGMKGAAVERCWPWRLRMNWKRPSEPSPRGRGPVSKGDSPRRGEGRRRDDHT